MTEICLLDATRQKGFGQMKYGCRWNTLSPLLSTFSTLESRDYIVGRLLTCSPEQFSYWLEYHDQPEGRVEGRIFSAKDVRQFEKICSTLSLEDDFTGDEKHDNSSDSDSDTSDSDHDS